MPELPVDEKRSGLRADVDMVYAETVRGHTRASGYLIYRKGNSNEVFFQFYYPFCDLFAFTRYLKEMQSVDQNLIADIDEWRLAQRRSIKRGVELFSQYQKELIQNSVIVLRSD